MDKNIGRPIEDMRLAQIDFLINDIEKTKKEFVRPFGVEGSETVDSGEYEITYTEHRGRPASKARYYMTFFYFGDLQMEPIQPSKEPSIQREHLKQFSERIRHISFNMKGMQRIISVCENWGMKPLQRGEYRGANGRYTFMGMLDSLKAVAELLEQDKQEEVR